MKIKLFPGPVYASAAAAYTAWATELGVSDTASLTTISSETPNHAIALDFAPEAGLNQTIIWSPGFSFSFYDAASTVDAGSILGWPNSDNIAALPVPIAPDAPVIQLSHGVTGWSWTFANAKWQKTSTAAIFFAAADDYDQVFDYAVRIQADKIDVVATCEPNYFGFVPRMYRTDPTAYPSPLEYEILIEDAFDSPEPARTYSYSNWLGRFTIEGVVTDDGSPSANRKVRALSLSDYTVHDETVSNGSGAYLLNVRAPGDYCVLALSKDSETNRNDVVARVTVPA